MVWGIAQTRRLLRRRRQGLLFSAEQRATLVNVKLKWVKDRALDSVVARERHLRQVHRLLELISTDPRGGVPANDLPSRPLHLGKLSLLPSDFLLRFPALFRRSSAHSIGPSSPWIYLTDDALKLRELELSVLRNSEREIVDRLRRLLMLTVNLSLPLHTVDQLRWDIGLPSEYQEKILHRYPHFFDFVRPDEDERVWLKLSSWDPVLAVSELQRSSTNGGFNGDSLAFPVSFTRGFCLRRKCMMWLQEWQTLPYTSPYADPSGLDPRTDVSEKRIVGLFHELLHLTIGKKTERSNLSNLRKPLRLPQKFTKVFERHPGIFYLSQKLGVHTVVLREAYGGGRELLRKHPLVGIREKYAAMMNVGRPEIRWRFSISEESEVASSEEFYHN
ncbi:protein ROOT PRIMORDIUM DEFECTIVE 1-like [Phalaenopsis equestris]|uniref:protein ROOT PRIMORDIUM DEFECTIVE 1-like n=1 Tax=Phalaenopsis equestris TaxID=78828 RepID=UPI0009E47F34|nr:protein ROOT PRIMORDIUM DEFECTIVE 1-like [Phalaenopsis equestris]XP_020581297.1 protein ROOT PRIMORDIUM DEFECTIVE 1-like [Phalaenopsis equestris]XP_020581298.1 protein ROOT PRIMORDIUM DEFECTIVE 1-like [Phalaenopsis equestris]XP_020581299.1 protein ROOT PRIMORDIUM DEFECTIVE 1-like [Phalaenopsis equestris]XP_020581300.1 protein ROOT PRIMORDIUM DEFECTIVE 1-like [Phalaenopsis equestris]XP_020581302.1 protein ROOT PRIMORDIUM DEFECTIVE 1-like [Phalaenopsis equestris]XP_020581303.1 protein ROOT P